MGYTVGMIAEKSNIKPHVLRYYEKEGLLPHIGRTESGVRRYTDADLEWLGLICCLKNTGMSIKQIRDFVNLSLLGPDTLKKRCEMLLSHKKEVESHIEEMNRHLEKVSCKIAYFTRQYEEYCLSNEKEDERISKPTEEMNVQKLPAGYESSGLF